MDTLTAHHAPALRTVRLRSALAIGAIAVGCAFGAGFVLADAPVAPVAATASGPGTAAGHTVDQALTESLALKLHSARNDVADIRKRRVE